MQPPFTRGVLYAAIFAAAWAVWIVPEIVGGVFDRIRHPKGRSERNYDGGSGAIILFGILLLPIAGTEIADHIGSSAIAWHRYLLFAAGIAAVLLGVLLRWYAVRTLGPQFSRHIAIQEHHEIVTAGPYRLIRHPSYSGTLLTLLGIGVATDNWLSLLVMVAGGVGVYTYRVSREERVLIRELGRPYLRYMKQTKRFIPWLW